MDFLIAAPCRSQRLLTFDHPARSGKNRDIEPSCSRSPSPSWEIRPPQNRFGNKNRLRRRRFVRPHQETGGRFVSARNTRKTRNSSRQHKLPRGFDNAVSTMTNISRPGENCSSEVNLTLRNVPLLRTVSGDRNGVERPAAPRGKSVKMFQCILALQPTAIMRR